MISDLNPTTLPIRQKSNPLQSRVWLITGANRGIGHSIAREALREGQHVVATARNLKKLKAAFADVTAAEKANLSLQAMDISRSESIQAAVCHVREQFGRVDVLVNNAGYGQLGYFEDIHPVRARQQFDTNVFGVMDVTRQVLPLMREQRSGQIYNLSSVCGVVGFAGASLYAASKFAIEGFSESLAQEVSEFGISVTLVEAGYMRTDFLDKASVRYEDSAIEDYQQPGKTLRESNDAMNHRQQGDPARLASALLALSREAVQPKRFIAGSDAYGYIKDALKERQTEMNSWKMLSLSTDFVEDADDGAALQQQDDDGVYHRGIVAMA
ncbi:SDR family oxidoreductase [Pokkaliibacter sp. CJK22405]|uniref:SDR family oxidoreductase n=1 Tax=Pokkaliibacter sp. CJK22405 TaxID=3384615 RepID=UPI003984AC23